MVNSCPFCNASENRLLYDTDKVIMIKDLFPVTEHHTLVIPKEHIDNPLDIPSDVFKEMARIARIRCLQIKSLDPTITGFNIGFNIGEDAGQTVEHCHLHIIPRRSGDSPDPVGGIRKVLNGIGRYK